MIWNKLLLLFILFLLLAFPLFVLAQGTYVPSRVPPPRTIEYRGVATVNGSAASDGVNVSVYGNNGSLLMDTALIQFGIGFYDHLEIIWDDNDTHVDDPNCTTYFAPPNGTCKTCTPGFCDEGISFDDISLEQITFKVGGTAVDTPQYLTVNTSEEGDLKVQNLVIGNVTPLAAPTNFSCVLNIDNSSVDINWSNVAEATSYNLYYSSNISAIMILDVDSVGVSVTTVAGITDLNFTDTNASQDQKRYYTVAAVKGSQKNLTSDRPCGKFTFNYTALNSTSFGVLGSNRIDVYLNLSIDAETFLQGIVNQTNPAISRFDKTNASGEFLTTHIRGFAANNFTLQEAIGYQVAVNNPAEQTIVGIVAYTPYTLEYVFVNSTTFGSLASNWRGIYDSNKTFNASSFLNGINFSLPAISRLDKTNASGEFLTTHIKGFASNVFDLFPGTGYQMSVPGSYNQTLCTGCFG